MRVLSVLEDSYAISSAESGSRFICLNIRISLLIGTSMFDDIFVERIKTKITTIAKIPESIIYVINVTWKISFYNVFVTSINFSLDKISNKVNT